MEAGGSWGWTIENGQYCIQSDGIDTTWYANGSPHKGCFQYYHCRYWYEGQDHFPLLAGDWSEYSLNQHGSGIFGADDAIVAYSGYSCGSQH